MNTKNIGLLLFFGIIWNCSGAEITKKICKNVEEGYKVCKRDGVLLSVEVIPNGKKWSRLHLADGEIASITSYAFRVLDITKLVIEFSNRELYLIPASFCGLEALKSLEILSGKISAVNEIFYELKSLESISLNGQQTPLRIELKRYPKLNHLKIINTNLKTIGFETCFETSPALLDLELLYSNINGIKLFSFALFNNLQSLTMVSNNLKMIIPGALHGLHNLENLTITSNYLSVVKNGTFNELKNLKILDLSANRIQQVEVGAFSLNNISEISLAENNLTYLQVGIFSNLKTLKRLILNDNKILIGPGAFSGLKLTVLKLQRNSINELSSSSFQGLSINRLHLSSNPIVLIENNLFENLSIDILYIKNMNLALNKNAWGLSEKTVIIST